MTEDNVVRGGKTVFGGVVGVLMLETRFPRIPGDIGNAGTWPFPVLFKVVPGASPDRVVLRQAEGLLDAFIDGARELVTAGVDGITTTCGFLALFQDELASAVNVPVAASSLMQVPMVQKLLPPGRKVGVITISKSALTEEHLKASNVDIGTPVVGTDEGRELSRVMLGDEPELNLDVARADVIDAGRRLLNEEPQTGAIVLECTNMVPFAADLRHVLGVPVFSIYSFITWFQAGLLPRVFNPHLIDCRN